LRDQHRTVGVFDARYAGIDTDPQSRTPSYDQLENSVSGALVAVLNDYLCGRCPCECSYMWLYYTHDLDRNS
jgi:hypothetical protein